MRRRLFTTVLLVLALVAGCGPTRSWPAQKSRAPSPARSHKVADTVFLGGTIFTGNAAEPVVEALAIRGAKILAVGKRTEIELLIGPSTVVVRLEADTVLPGLVDAHGHMMGLGHSLQTLDLNGARSYEEILARVAKAAAEKDTGWIRGRGWDQNDWRVQSFPDGRKLEEIAPGRAVWLTRVDGHAGLASPTALRAGGVNENTPAPQGGRILRDQLGQPTGVLIDSAMGLVTRRIPPPDRPRRLQMLRSAIGKVLQVGITGVHDMGVSADTLELYRELDRKGELPLRVYAAISVSDPNLEQRYAHGPVVGERLTIRAVKMLADGALGSRGAALLENYADDPDNKGHLLLSTDELETLVGKAAEAGFQPCVHAIGDRANRVTLDAFEKVAEKSALKKLRPRIEHAQIVPPQDIPRFASLGVIASMQPTHATSDMPWVEARLGESRVAGAYAWDTLRRSGATLALGSDFPVERPEILEGLFAALTRTDRSGQPSDGWRPKERLTFGQALAGFTSGAAWASFTESRRGVLRVGYDADLTVVTGDLGPLRDAPHIHAHRLLRAQVRLTMVAGVVAYRRM